MSKIRVLTVDDSALMRQVLATLLAKDPEIEVVGSAPDPYIAREKIKALNPDVLTLDVEMPKMDGLTFLEKLMRGHPMPVVMVSSLTEVGCETTLRALELGAVDFITKPKIDLREGMEDVAQDLIAKVKAAATARVRPLSVTHEASESCTNDAARTTRHERCFANLDDQNHRYNHHHRGFNRRDRSGERHSGGASSEYASDHHHATHAGTVHQNLG